MKILTACAGEIDVLSLVRIMVGRDVSAFYSRQLFPQGKPAIEARHLCGNGVSDIGFTAYRGQILGFAGMVGSGRSELMTLLMGGAKRTSGEILIDGKPVDRDPWDATRRKSASRTGTGCSSSTRSAQLDHRELVNRKLVHPLKEDTRSASTISRAAHEGDRRKRRRDALRRQPKVVLAKWFPTATSSSSTSYLWHRRGRKSTRS